MLGGDWVLNAEKKGGQVLRNGGRGGDGETAVEVFEGVVEGFDVVELVHVLGVVEKAGRLQTVEGFGCRFAAMCGESLEKVDEEAEFLAHVNPSSGSRNGAGRR